MWDDCSDFTTLPPYDLALSWSGIWGLGIKVRIQGFEAGACRSGPQCHPSHSSLISGVRLRALGVCGLRLGFGVWGVGLCLGVWGGGLQIGTTPWSVSFDPDVGVTVQGSGFGVWG